MRNLLVLAAAAASALAVSPGHTATVTFEDQTAFRCDLSGSGSSGGLNYSYGFAACYYSAQNPADFPTALSSTVMAVGYTPVTFTAADGGAFNISTLDLAFGPFSHSGVDDDSTLVTGLTSGGQTLSTSLSFGYGFTTSALNWSDLVSLTFSGPVFSSEYLAFDNINYTQGAVPEPASWAMMVGGFGLVGGALRSRRKATVSFA